MLNYFGDDIKGKTFAISGFGNVAWGTVKKIAELGGKVVTISGPDGYVYDKDGIPCPTASNLISFSAEGAGRIYGTDNGDQRETESFARHDKKVLAGFCVACARSIKDQPGKLTLTVKAEGLVSAEITIEVK